MIGFFWSIKYNLKEIPTDPQQLCQLTCQSTQCYSPPSVGLEWVSTTALIVEEAGSSGLEAAFAGRGRDNWFSMSSLLKVCMHWLMSA